MEACGKVLWLGTHSLLSSTQAILRNCPRPTEVRDVLQVWGKRDPEGRQLMKRSV